MSRTRVPIEQRCWFKPLLTLIEQYPNAPTQFLADRLNKPTQSSTVRRYLYQMRGQGWIEMSGSSGQQRWTLAIKKARE